MASRKSVASRARQPAAPTPDTGRRDKRPTINDVARLAHVSKKTVSRVINESPFVHKATREKINAVIGELGFVPDLQARGLAFRRSFLIGLICENPLPPETVELQQGILDALRGTSFELVIRACASQDAKFLQEVRAFVEGQRLFAVLLPVRPCEAAGLTKLLSDLGCPFEQIANDKSLRGVASAAVVKLIDPMRQYAP